MLKIEEDFNRVSGGYANLWIAGQLPESPVTLRIRRLATEPHHLGPNGWQVQEADLSVQEAVQDGANVRLLLGPEVCDHILEDTEVEIKAPALNLRQVIVWPYVAPAVDREERLGSVLGATKTTNEDTSANGGNINTSKSKKPEKSDLGQKSNGLNGQKEKTTGKENGNGGKTSGTGEPPIEDENKTKPKWLIWIVGLGILVVAALAAYFLLFNKPEPDPVLDQSDETEQTEVEETGQEEPEPVEPEAVDTTDILLEEARACLESGCTGDEFFVLTERLEAIEDYDNALRLADITSSNGNPAGDLWIANLYDPLTFEEQPGGPTEANAERALQRYQKAIEGGLEDAQEGIETLCSAVKERADAGGGPLSTLERNEATRLADAYCGS